MYMYSVLYSVYNYIYIGHTLEPFHKMPRVSASPVDIIVITIIRFDFRDKSNTFERQL